MSLRHVLLPLLLLFLFGCAVNPVTGEKEFTLVSEQQELAIGKQQYAPARQAQGGDFVTDPELTTYVSQVGQRLAKVSDRSLPYEFKVLNNSIPNAWALPGGKISINRGLLTELNSEAELAAVLGHEIVHAAARHGAASMSRGMLLQVGVLGASLATQGESYSDLVQMGAGIGAQLINQKYSRGAERESDFYGMQYMVRAGYDPQGAVDLQRTFVKLSEERRQDWLSGLFASHPPSQERVENNVLLLANLPKGGEVGKERFQSKTAHLRKTKSAYEAYDKGREALAKKNLQESRRLAEKALAIEPNEALFYGLMGDLEQKNNRLKPALEQYDKAISLNPDFFYYYLQRGKAYEQLNLNDNAQTDLERSTELLPTAGAHFSLGNLARKAGRFDDAKQHYAKVAGSKGEVGQQAYGALVDLDLKDHPNKYLKFSVGRDSQGKIVAQISNPTPRDIEQIRLAIQYQSADGKLVRSSRNLYSRIQAKSKKLFDLGLTGKINPKQLNTLQVSILTAQVAQ